MMVGINKRKWKRYLILALLLALAIPASVAAATLVIDGSFDDWAGQTHIDDPSGDGPTANTDITAFYWGTNPDDEHIYWMMERDPPQSGNPSVYYWVFLDTNNDGDYDDPEDRTVRVFYDPVKEISDVVVTVFTGAGNQISQDQGDWGESTTDASSRAEWRVSFADLGIDAHQTINMVGAASQSSNPNVIDRIPEAGDITWAPIPVLGWPWLIAIGVLVISLAWYTRGRFM